MANMDDRNYSNRDIANRNISQQQVPHSANVTAQNRVVPTANESIAQRESSLPSNAAYSDGYRHGRVSQQQLYSDDQVARDNENAGRGLLVGILVTSLAAFAAGAIFLLNQRNQTPPVIQRVVPASPAPAQSPQVRERVIERDRVVPVPQSQPPQVNITVPEQSSPTQTAPTSPESQPGAATDSTQVNPSSNPSGNSDTN